MTSTNARADPPDPPTLFILSAFVASRFHAESLVLALFSVRSHHPGSFVLLVDRASPHAIEREALPPRLRDGLRVLPLRPPVGSPNQREYGAYAAALNLLREAREAGWRVRDFDAFVFMQASIVLTEPLPLQRGTDSAPACSIRPLGALACPPSFECHPLQEGWKYHEIRTYLTGVGLRGNGSNAALSAPSVWHNSFVANREGVRSMLLSGRHRRPPAGGSNAFDHPRLGVSKFCSEHLTGEIVKALTGSASCVRGLPWRSTSRPFYRLHGSDFRVVLPADVVLSSVLRFADGNLDGSVSRRELLVAIKSDFAAWRELWGAACLAFPIASEPAVAAFIAGDSAKGGRGPPPLPGGVQLERELQLARQLRRNRTGDPRCDALSLAAFWADESAAILGRLPSSSRLMDFHRAGWLNDEHATPFKDPLTEPPGAGYWGRLAPAKPAKRSGGPHARPPERPQPHAGALSALEQYASRFTRRLFSLADADRDGTLSFTELSDASSGGHFFAPLLLPSCLELPRFSPQPTVEGSSAAEVSRARGGSAAADDYWSPTGWPSLYGAKLRSVDLEARLSRTMNQPKGDWRDGRTSGLVIKTLTTSALFYLRWSLAALTERSMASPHMNRRCSSLPFLSGVR